MSEEIKNPLIGKRNYTIIASEFHYGQIVQNVKKEDVKINCDKFRKIFETLTKEKCFCQIEVVNNDTGEIREYWNNHENKLNF